MGKITKFHADGSPCLEGTKSVPKKYEPCCELFNSHTSTCVHDIRYEWWGKRKIWVIAISEESGGGGIEIKFCPHCGSKLISA